jgi:chromate transporter
MSSMSQQRDRAPPARISSLELFIAFSRVALSSFGGGVPPLLHREFVERRETLSNREFAAAFAVARIMPGTNVVNLAVLIGSRARGAIGACAAVLGLLIGPIILSVGLVVLYGRFGEIHFIALALKGAAAGAAGLLMGMAVQLATQLLKRLRRETHTQAAIPLAVVTAAGVFAVVAIFEARTVWAVLCFVPTSVAVFYATARPSAEETQDD